MTKVNEKFLGNFDLEKRSDDIVSTKPNTDHVVRSWRSARGLKTILDEAIVDEICLLIAAGATIPVAAAARGYGNAWRHWNTRAREAAEAGLTPGFGEGESPYLAWAVAVREAKASFVANCLLQISAGHPQWKAMTWLLERRYPEFYQEQKKTQVTVKTEREEAAALSTDELRRLVLDTDTEAE